TYTRAEGDRGSVTTGALANAPVAGRWFSEGFQVLVQNAYPALADVPPRSSSAASSSVASSTVVVSSVTSSVDVSSSSSVVSSSSVDSSSSDISSSVASSDSSSSVGNQAPEVNLTLANYGSTVHVNLRNATDPEGDALNYLIDFGDGTSVQ